MATSSEFIEFVVECIERLGNIRYKKMFGEYMIYIDDKPILLVCDSIVYVKKLPDLENIMISAETGVPYKGAKEHYILDVEDSEQTENAINVLKQITPIPKPRKRKE